MRERWQKQSIERKIPAAFVGLLALLGAVHMVAAYRGFEGSASDALRERLANVGSQIALLGSSGMQQRSTALRRAFEAPAFRPILDGSADPAEVLPRIASSADSTTTLILDSELEVVAAIGRAVPPQAQAALRDVASSALEIGGQLRVGSLIVVGTQVQYWVAMSTRRTDGSRIVVAQLRRIGEGESEQSDALQSLIGETVVLFANAGGGGPWVQLNGTVVEPPTAAGDVLPPRYTRAGTEYLGNAVAVPGTPWMVVTEAPAALARARALAFLRRTLPFGVLVLVAGAVVAWVIGRRFTQPMRSIASATQALGQGVYDTRVEVKRRDELGVVAHAFNEMAAEIQRNHAELEERVRQRTTELQAVNHELQAFSYSVSHDLRSPLRSIDGFSQALLEDYGEQLEPQAQDYLHRVRAGAQRMGHLIDDLLQLSRVTRQPITRTRVDISEMAEQLVADLRQAHPARDVAVEIAPDIIVHGDRGLMHVVLQNLLDNAWKFTTKTAQARIEVGRDVDGSIFVRDNGAGFSMEYADQLFTPFQRLHGAHEFGGTGIGLATVQRVINRHGGRVWATAAVGAGATIHFTVSEGVDADEYDTAGRGQS